MHCTLKAYCMFLQMFWQTMPNEDLEVPLEPAPVEDLIYDQAPECPSDQEDA
jgi:hypothetical protein